MKLFYILFCNVYSATFTLFENLLFKKTGELKKNYFFRFNNINFSEINYSKFYKKKENYLEKIIFPENKIFQLINEIFIKNKLTKRIQELTGFSYTISFFTAYKTYKIKPDDINKNIYANHFHKDKPYTKNMIKLIFSFNEITDNDGPMELKTENFEKVCLKKNEIFLFYPNNVYHRATSPKSGERFQIMFQLNPSIKWQINNNIYKKQELREPKFPFFSYFFDKKSLLMKNHE